jgi:hypothetical protein
VIEAALRLEGDQVPRALGGLRGFDLQARLALGLPARGLGSALRVALGGEPRRFGVSRDPRAEIAIRSCGPLAAAP